MKCCIVALQDTAFVTKPAFLVLIPILLQIIVTSITKHNLQHPDCFHVLKNILQLTSQGSSGGSEDESFVSRKTTGSNNINTYTLLHVHKDVIQVIVYLIGKYLF